MIVTLTMVEKKVRPGSGKEVMTTRCQRRAANRVNLRAMEGIRSGNRVLTSSVQPSYNA
jgi:hypothetical protein